MVWFRVGRCERCWGAGSRGERGASLGPKLQGTRTPWGGGEGWRPGDWNIYIYIYNAFLRMPMPCVPSHRATSPGARALPRSLQMPNAPVFVFKINGFPKFGEASFRCHSQQKFPRKNAQALQSELGPAPHSSAVKLPGKRIPHVTHQRKRIRTPTEMFKPRVLLVANSKRDQSLVC